MSKSVTPSIEDELTDGSPEIEQQSETTEEYGQYPPGTIVLAKLKSFPPWPAIVIPNDLIPDGVLSSKPKNPGARTTTARPKRGRASTPAPVDSRLWCVRFLRDDTFMWATSNDITLLTTEQIETFLKSKKVKKVIRSAYEMALDPPDVEEFIIYGSDGKPIDINNEADDADFEDDHSGNGDEFDEDADEDEDMEDVVSEDDDDLELSSSAKKRKHSGSARSTPKKKAKPRPKSKAKATPVKTGRKKKPVIEQVEEKEPDTSSDEDWDVIDDENDPVAVDVLTSEDIAKIIKKTQPVLIKARFQLQQTFLSDKEIDEKPKSAFASLDQLESLENPPIGLVKQVGLHKVLFNILKRPDLTTRELGKFRAKLNDLVKEWFNIEIQVDDAWNFEPEIEEEKVEEESGDVKVESEETKNESPHLKMDDVTELNDESKQEDITNGHAKEG